MRHSVTQFFFLLLLSFSVVAAPVLTPAEVKKLIGPYPRYGSVEEANDDHILLEFQATRTQEMCKAAALQSDITLDDFFGGVLSAQELDSFRLEYAKLRGIIGASIGIAKTLYNRPRPYMRNKDIVPCIDKERSSSYPSGHSTLARALGKILSKKFPAKANAITKAADQAALNRVIGGVHHPSDIDAGQKLGDEIFKRLDP